MDGFETTVSTDFDFTLNSDNRARFVPVCGPFLGFSGGAVISFLALVSNFPISASFALDQPEIPSQPQQLMKMGPWN